MPANRLYHTWVDQIRQLCPEARKTLIHNFAWLLIGIYLSRTVHLRGRQQDPWTSQAQQHDPAVAASVTERFHLRPQVVWSDR